MFSVSLILQLYIMNILFTTTWKFFSSVYLSLAFQSNVGCFREGLPSLGPMKLAIYLGLIPVLVSVAASIALNHCLCGFDSCLHYCMGYSLCFCHFYCFCLSLSALKIITCIFSCSYFSQIIILFASDEITLLVTLTMFLLLASKILVYTHYIRMYI